MVTFLIGLPGKSVTTHLFVRKSQQVRKSDPVLKPEPILKAELRLELDAIRLGLKTVSCV